MKSTAFVAACGLVAACSAVASADVILDWNRELLSSVAAESMAPPRVSRLMAMVHVAQYEAVNSVSRTHRAFTSYIDCPDEVSKEAAAARAGRDVLAALFPHRAAQYDALLASHLSGIAAGTAKTNGLSLGQTAAARILSMRADDGSSTVVVDNGSNDIGRWRPTPPANATGLLPNWPNVTPWTMTSGSQFRPPPPPALTSAEYAAAYNEVKRLGSATGSDRTAEQTDIARMWAAGGGTVTPPGMWNQIAQQLSEHRGLSIDENARLFAMLGVGVTDAAVVSWDAKYEYDLWRPVTGIQLGDLDGNDATAGDADWMPLLTTPPFPAYTSGHSTFSAVSAEILASFFGTDDLSFTASGVGITRSFNSLWAAAEEAGMSRIYGGIHWQFDNTAGLSSGRDLAQYIAANFFLVPSPSGAAVLFLGTLTLARRRR
jgi:hypothetical protein